MRNQILIYVIALILAIPIHGHGQKKLKVPVAPDMLFAIGGEDANVTPSHIKVDPQGNTYVTGGFFNQYNKLDFDPSAAEYKIWQTNTSFIAKYSAVGALVWVKPYDGYAYGLDVDRNGNITIIGERSSTYQPLNGNWYVDALVMHLNNNGNLLWEKLIQSGTRNIPVDPERLHPRSDVQTGYKVTSDNAGNLIAAFSFGGSPDVGGIITAKGFTDGLVVKFDPSGNVLWKFNLGCPTGNFSNYALEALVDKDQNIIVAGYTDGTVDYNPLGSPVNITADNTVFVAKYSTAGILQWAKTFKVNATNNNLKLTLDGLDNIYISGSSSNTIDFGVPPILTTHSSQDIFIAKYASDGNLLYHTSIGGEGAMMMNSGIAIGADNSLYLTGNFYGTVDVDPSAAVAQLKTNETVDLFMIKYDDSGKYQWSFSIPSFGFGPNIIKIDNSKNLPLVGVQDMYVNSSDKIFLTGMFASTVNFNGTGCGINSLTASNINNPIAKYNDMFIVRYSPTIEDPITNNTATAPTVTTFCLGEDPALITGSIPVGDNYTYQWQQSLDNKTFTDITDAASKDFDPPVPTATTYYRRRLVTSECAVPNVSNVIPIILSTTPSPNTITEPAELSFCNVGDVTLIRGTILQAVGDVDYQWQQSADNVNFVNINGATRIDYDPPAVNVTTYFRRLITNLPCSIAIPSNTVKVTVLSVPVPSVSTEKTVCVGEGVTLNATGGIRYVWSPATTLSAADVASPIAKPTATTNYTVTIFNGNCVTALQVRVNVVNKPTVNAGVDKEIRNGEKVQLNAQVANVEGATYSWTPALYLDNPAIPNPMASPVETITYRLTVRAPNGCFIVSDDVVINVRFGLSVPNAFTPNGDGINDVLVIPGLDSYKQSIVTIVDRKGQPVFKSQSYSKPWDGTHDGKPLPVGTYYYVIELNDFDHKRLSGSISLMK
ncbi:gliding motility-associated C-terminal domain-containing protein [Pedobacter sp. PWIIR3]